MDQSEVLWIKNVSTEMNKFLKGVPLSLPEVAAMIGESARSIQRVRNGMEESKPYVVNGRIYAALFYHCGIVSADPRKIPGINVYRANRAWSEAKYQSWVRDQGNPIFISPVDTVGRLIISLLEELEGLISDEENSAFVEVFASQYNAELRKLRNVVRFFLLNPGDRALEREIQEGIQLSDFIGKEE